jgi:hypothetical protein
MKIVIVSGISWSAVLCAPEKNCKKKMPRDSPCLASAVDTSRTSERICMLTFVCCSTLVSGSLHSPTTNTTSNTQMSSEHNHPWNLHIARRILHLSTATNKRSRQLNCAWDPHTAMCCSIYLPEEFIHQWLYNPLLGPGRFFSFVIPYTVSRTPCTGDQPVARPLPTHRIAQTQN